MIIIYLVHEKDGGIFFIFFQIQVSILPLKFISCI